LEGEQIIYLPDRRQIGYIVIGEGKPVFYFHGTASSRLETLLLKELTESKEIQIIGIDRPGYGLSSFVRRRNLIEFTGDLNYLAHHLGIERFALLGWSGGGPHVLTYVALFPKRVTRAVIVSSPALPFDVATAHNNPLARYAMNVPALGKWAFKRLQTKVLKARRDSAAFMNMKDGKRLFGDWAPEDAKFFRDPAWVTLMLNSMAEAFRQNDYAVRAILQEHQLFMKNWDAPLTEIPPGKVYLWHGTEDKTCRVENACRIAKAVPEAHLEIFQGKGHCVMFDHLDRLRKILVT
jgi:pimeloyl-ACP methyl ester carboxylesterase